MSPIGFTIEKKIPNRLGRAGLIETPHGVIETPAFVVVGTKGTVKGVPPEQVVALGAQAVLANTYHLYLRPGSELVRDAGGLHAFMRWEGPIMTDSGGFQIFSLGDAYGKKHGKFLTNAEVQKLQAEQALKKSKKRSKGLVRIGEVGARFKALHLDGSEHLLTPEESMKIQHNLGADIIFALDICTAPDISHDDQRFAMERTHRWAERSLGAHRANGEAASKQALFGIVQGGPHKDLRVESAQIIASMDFDGFGIGGSYTKEEMADVLQWVNPILPEDKPRHLLGIGEPIQFFLGAEHGVETFDCVTPTREGRHGQLYTFEGKIQITNAKFARDFNPVDGKCGCATCTGGVTRATLHHLFRERELEAYTLASIHNLYFFVHLVKNIRESILDGRFAEYRDEFFARYRKV